ncbi:1622_t:CDS:2 [Ambispora gerdemannii]|uniref:1622_t:CDS:1 n=1 Tax=Ambispora gerdemannii TaxID=144530 RepID=A0A9N9A6A8_9GLOM|nr:1622_t:CDS:2 [Ambispora gerdemannii]
MVGKRKATIDDWDRHSTFELPIFIAKQATYEFTTRALKHISGVKRNILGYILHHVSECFGIGMHGSYSSQHHAFSHK